MTEIFDTYRVLWRRAQELGARVRYSGMLEDGEGWFHPNPLRLPAGHPAAVPTIELGRRSYDGKGYEPTTLRRGELPPPPDILQETVTLAHECGHFLSWKCRTPRAEWDAYFGAASRRDSAWAGISSEGSVTEYNERLRTAARTALTAEDMQQILLEEQRAWRFGRELLIGIGFDRLDYYAKREDEGLYHHRYRLGIDSLRPDDCG